MSVLTKLIKSLFTSGPAIAKPSSLNGATAQLTLEAYEALNPTQKIPFTNGVTATYATPNRYTSWRVTSFFEKEPDTLKWIEGFEPGDVLIDVGANVGMYSIWAALTRNVQVFSFEPESQNYALLNKNIILNNLSGRVIAYCCALSDEKRFSNLYLSTFMPGGSCHTFGEEIDFNLKPQHAAFTQGSFSISLDELVATNVLPIPNHIKIDVDGLEHKVVSGCRNLLADHRLKSVLIEINQNLAEHRALVELMSKFGFKYEQSQVESAMRTSGTFEGVGNYVFQR